MSKKNNRHKWRLFAVYFTNCLIYYDNCITAFHNGVLANNGDFTPRYPMWCFGLLIPNLQNLIPAVQDIISIQ